MTQNQQKEWNKKNLLLQKTKLEFLLFLLLLLLLLLSLFGKSHKDREEKKGKKEKKSHPTKSRLFREKTPMENTM
jgi:hypothetical protein